MKKSVSLDHGDVVPESLDKTKERQINRRKNFISKQSVSFDGVSSSKETDNQMMVPKLPSVCEDMSQILEKLELDDNKAEEGNQVKMMAHRVVIATHCDWFKKALLSGMKEAIDR